MTKYRDSCIPTSELVAQQKNQINEELLQLFSLAETYHLAEGSKITKSSLVQPSKIIDHEGNDITPSNMANFSHSILNYEGTYYLLLHDIIFYANLEDYDRGIRAGKLAINKRREIFFLKIIDSSLQLYSAELKEEATNEMRMAHELGESPHNKFLWRKNSNKEDIKIYMMLRYRGLPLDIIIQDKALLSWQKLDIAVQCLTLIRNFARKYLHRDIKVDNFVGEFDNIKGNYRISLIDFSETIALKHNYYTSLTLVGTAGYRSPSLESSYLYNVYNFRTEMFAAAITIGHITCKISKNSLSEQEKELHEKLIEFIRKIITFSENDIKRHIRLFERKIDQIKYLLTESKEEQELYDIREAVRETVSEYVEYTLQNYRNTFFAFSLSKNHGEKGLQRAWKLEESINQAQNRDEMLQIFKSCMDSYTSQNAGIHNHSLTRYIAKSSTLSEFLKFKSVYSSNINENPQSFWHTPAAKESAQAVKQHIFSLSLSS
jgi:hypothetical protein